MNIEEHTCRCVQCCVDVQEHPPRVNMDYSHFKLQSLTINKGLRKINDYWRFANDKTKVYITRSDDMRSDFIAAQLKAQEKQDADAKWRKKQLAIRAKKTQASRDWHKRGLVQKDTTPNMVTVDNPDLIACVQRSTVRVKVTKPRRRKRFAVQSAEVESIVSFMNAEEAPVVGYAAGNNVFSEVDKTTETDIQEFFARPVRITTITWNESDTVGTNLSTFNPWSLWANNTYVKKKLDNYSWFRGDLNIKIQLTASPFYYGMVKMVYRPLQQFKASTIRLGSGNQHLVLFSQQPHIDLLIGEHDSWNFKAPFILNKNWVNIQSAADIVNLGEFRSYVYSQLQSANGVTGTGITLTIYAWVDNVQLSGASTGFSMQSDEYGEGVVSQPASWIASAATYLEDIPVIGPFATATRIGANAISAIASMFGFTNVPVISDTEPYRPEAFPKLASSEIGFPVEKLTLDPKNELSVDPRIIGMNSGVDEMSMAYLSGRESFLTSASWTTSNLVDDMLFYSRVNPNLFTTDDTLSAIYMTPMCWVGKAFKDWRGSIIFRFHIISSKYHKGKLKISFDPTGYSGQNLGTVTTSSNIVHTAIVDIGETTNVEFEVPYQQALQFLILRNTLTTSQKGWAVNSALSTFSAEQDYDNGYLTVRVLNPLTAPVASSNVDVHVYVRAGSDIEYANPSTIDEVGNLSMFAPQSEELSGTTPADNVVLAKTGGTADRQYLVHYGENVRSLRQLLHRYEFSSMEMIAPSDTGTQKLNSFSKYFYKMPRAPGYLTNSLTKARNQANTADVGYNFVNMTNLTWFSNGFLCYRGGINWTFDISSLDGPIHHVKVFKDNTSSVDAQTSSSAQSTSTASKQGGLTVTCRNSGACGQAMTDQRTNAGLNVLCPNMSRYKFQSTKLDYSNTGSTSDGSNLDAFVLFGYFPYPSTTTTAPVILSTYNSTGVDFGLHFFINVPTVYAYTTTPTPI